MNKWHGLRCKHASSISNKEVETKSFMGQGSQIFEDHLGCTLFFAPIQYLAEVGISICSSINKKGPLPHTRYITKWAISE